MAHPYASAAYADCFALEYTPIYLPNAQTHVLKRAIPNTSHFDALGCYPLSPIAQNADLAEDFAALEAEGIVSLVLVADPFASPPLEVLENVFDRAFAYKEHYINDFSIDGVYESKNHRYKVNRANRDCEVRIIRLDDYLNEWCAMYNALIEKHAMRGISAFSRGHFECLCALSPLMVGAFEEGTLIAAQLWFEYGTYAYSHLVASSERGYELRASYALYDFSLRHYADKKMAKVDLGGGAGVSSASAGLAQLKKGFSTGAVPCYLCSKIINAEIYAELSAGKKTDFFPAYRA